MSTEAIILAGVSIYVLAMLAIGITVAKRAGTIAPFLNPNISSKQKLIVSRIAIPVCGVIAVYVALDVQAVLEIMLDANSFLLVGFA